MSEVLLNEVFIKELHESGIDQVFYVQNLPKRFIYQLVPNMVVRYDRDGYTDGTMIVDPSGKKVDGLLDGLEHSQNGDGSVVFRMSYEAAREALASIDAYISGTLPRDVVVPKRVDYPLDRTNSLSMPKTRNLIPTVILPIPTDLREETSQVSPEVKPSPESPSRTLSPAQLEASRARMAKARAVKQAKKELMK